jgi:flagellar hook-length control protein FliK
MALSPSSHAPAHAHAHAHATAAHAATHAASTARARIKPGLSADEGEDGGGFAAQLLRAQPAADKDDKPVDADSKANSAKKAAKDDDKEAADGKDAKTPEAKPQAVDPNAMLPWMQAQAIAPATTSLADKPVVVADDADLADDPLGALRKAAGKGAKDGKDALAGLGTGKDAKVSDATALTGKGGQAAADPTAALAKAEGAANAASQTRDSMAALLPQPDPVTVQAGAIGAAPTASLDANQANQATPTPPAQAALPMPPQSPAFMPALGQQIAVWMRDGVQHAEVQLSPQDLGPIRVKIEMAGAQTRVEMSADVQSTRDALQQALPQLSDSLGQVGLSLSGGGVSDQPTFQSQAQANADGGFGGTGGRAGGGSPGHGGAGNVGEDIGVASAARQMAQRRGLLDMYA